MTDWVQKTIDLFASSLHGNLKSRMKGHIYCAVEDGNLIVSISYKDVTYSYKKEHIIDAIHNGITVNDIAKEIEYDYADILRKVFFCNASVKHSQI